MEGNQIRQDKGPLPGTENPAQTESASSSSKRVVENQPGTLPRAKRPVQKRAVRDGVWARKRPPEESATELKDSVEADTGEHIDADVPIKMTKEQTTGTDPTDAAEGPKDANMGSLSAAKRELLPMIERQLRGAMRRQGVDAKTREIEDMAEC